MQYVKTPGTGGNEGQQYGERKRMRILVSDRAEEQSELTLEMVEDECWFAVSVFYLLRERLK